MDPSCFDQTRAEIEQMSAELRVSQGRHVWDQLGGQSAMRPRAFSHALDLPTPPEKAIRLFTAQGHALWVPGWEPRYVDPVDGSQAVGMVWTTEQDRVWWLCMAWDPSGHVEYLRLSPGVKLAHISATAFPEKDGSRIKVSFDWKALSPRGVAEIGAITHERFVSDIHQWRHLILEAIQEYAQPD